MPSAVDDELIANNKVQSSDDPSSPVSETDDDYEEDIQKIAQKPTDEAEDAGDSDDDEDDDDDDEYDGDDNEIEIDDRTKGKRKDGLYAEEIDVIKDRINKREWHRQFTYILHWLNGD